MLFAQDAAGISEITTSLYNNKDVTEGAKQSLDNFRIAVQRRPGGILLKGLEGTAWKKLSFTLDDSEAQMIDQYGRLDCMLLWHIARLRAASELHLVKKLVKSTAALPFLSR